MAKLFDVFLLRARVFWNKSSFVCLCGRRNPRNRITIITLQFAVVHMLQKNKDNTLVSLELHYVQLHAICTILLLYLGIYTQYLIYIEKPVLCTSRSLVLYFFKWEHGFSLQAFLLGKCVSWKQRFCAALGQCNVSEMQVCISVDALKHLANWRGHSNSK